MSNRVRGVANGGLHEALAPLVTSREALERCAPLIARRPFLLVSDFDGTLSRIQLDPWAAEIIPAARRALRQLAVVPGIHVCLLSGRLARDLAGRARVGGATYIGNHGMERGHLARRERANHLAVELTAVAPELVSEANEIGVRVAAAVNEAWLVLEPKPAAVAFHFRGAPDLAAASVRVRAAVEEADPAQHFVRHPGRRVLELRPADALGKGEALEGLVRELRPASAVVLGDDITDAQAFRALRRPATAGTVDGLAIAVQARAEVPRDVLAAADLALASPNEAARLLTGLARLSRSASS
jgi:trehalose-phosphatase